MTSSRFTCDDWTEVACTRNGLHAVSLVQWNDSLDLFFVVYWHAEKEWDYCMTHDMGLDEATSRYMAWCAQMPGGAA